MLVKEIIILLSQLLKDFSKSSLLLVNGKTDKRIFEIGEKKLQQLSSNKYKLDVNITVIEATDPNPFYFAIMIEKISGKSNIKLEVTLQKDETNALRGYYTETSPGKRVQMQESTKQLSTLQAFQRAFIIMHFL